MRYAFTCRQLFIFGRQEEEEEGWTKPGAGREQGGSRRQLAGWEKRFRPWRVLRLCENYKDANGRNLCSTG